MNGDTCSGNGAPETTRDLQALQKVTTDHKRSGRAAQTRAHAHKTGRAAPHAPPRHTPKGKGRKSDG